MFNIITKISPIILLSLMSCLDPQEPGNLVPKTVAEDSSLPVLEINNTRLHVQTFGDATKPVLIFLHGGPGNDHRPLLSFKSLADNYFLVFFDQRGSGLSQRHDKNQLSLDLYAKDLEKLIEHFAPNNKPVVLIGHSWGGQYATMYMNKHPERLSGCVMLEPGKLSTELGKNMAAVKLNLLAPWVSDLAWGRQLVAAKDHASADYYMAIGAAASSEAQPQRHSKMSPAWRLGAAVLIHVYFDELENKLFDFTTNLNQVNIPILFLAGQNTEDLGVDFQRTQIRKFNNASLEIIPNAGHSDVIWDQAQNSIIKIRTYLNNLNLGN